MSIIWNPTNTKKLIELSNQNLTYQQIAEELGTTKNSVAGKIHRMKSSQQSKKEAKPAPKKAKPTVSKSNPTPTVNNAENLVKPKKEPKATKQTETLINLDHVKYTNNIVHGDDEEVIENVEYQIIHPANDAITHEVEKLTPNVCHFITDYNEEEKNVRFCLDFAHNGTLYCKTHYESIHKKAVIKGSAAAKEEEAKAEAE